jgi:hypothetical protein
MEGSKNHISMPWVHFKYSRCNTFHICRRMHVPLNLRITGSPGADAINISGPNLINILGAYLGA